MAQMLPRIVVMRTKRMRVLAFIRVVPCVIITGKNAPYELRARRVRTAERTKLAALTWIKAILFLWVGFLGMRMHGFSFLRGHAFFESDCEETGYDTFVYA